MKDLSKNGQFAMDIATFSRLVDGDIKTCISMLHFIDRNEQIKEKLMEIMFDEYVKHVAEKEDENV